MTVITSLYAQNGKLSLQVFPSSTQVRINGVIYTSDNLDAISLPPGKTIIEYWAPKFATVRDTLTILEGGALGHAKALKILDENYRRYDDLKNERNSYKFSTTMQGVGFGILVGTSIYAGLTKDNNWEEPYNRALEAKLVYENSALTDRTIIEARDIYNRAAAEFDERQRAHNTRIATTVVGGTLATGALVYYIIKRQKDTPESPVYESQKPFGDVSFTPIIDYDSGNLTVGTLYTF